MKYILYFLLLIISITLALGFGTIELSWEQIFNLDSQTKKIIFEFRLPRILIAVSLGSGLSVCGLTYQSIFKNNLASPYTLGISASAAFGASLVFIFPALSHFLSFEFSALLFAGLHITLLVIIANKKYSSNNLLLCGVMLSFFFGSLILLLQYLASPEALLRSNRWLLGNLEASGYNLPILFLILSTCLIYLSFKRSKALDLAWFGEEYAHSQGINLKIERNLILFSSSILIALAVAYCGPIGFIGIIIPHLARSLHGPVHKNLVPSTALLGAIFLVISDLFARLLIRPAEIPVGVITAIIGCPVFILILLKSNFRN